MFHDRERCYLCTHKQQALAVGSEISWSVKLKRQDGTWDLHLTLMDGGILTSSVMSSGLEEDAKPGPIVRLFGGSLSDPAKESFIALQRDGSTDPCGVKINKWFIHVQLEE